MAGGGEVQDMLANAGSWFERQRREHLAVLVGYLPVGASRPVTCRATPTIGRWEGIDSTGQMVRIETRDFIVGFADYAADPVRGDRIVVEEAGIERTYEVVIPAGSQQAWRWVDRNQGVRRIHTLEIEKVTNGRL
jgi:hypothetical protein